MRPSDTAEFLDRLNDDRDRSFIEISSELPRIEWKHSPVDNCRTNEHHRSESANVPTGKNGSEERARADLHFRWISNPDNCLYIDRLHLAQSAKSPSPLISQDGQPKRIPAMTLVTPVHRISHNGLLYRC